MEAAFAYDFASFTHAGGRARNEDSMRLLLENGRAAVLVADGLGGQGDGDMAARMATELVGDQARLQSSWTASVAQALFAQADQAMQTSQALLGNRMMSTLAALFVQGDKATLAHMGDTRIYWFRGARLFHQTEDHSVSQAAVLAGEIAPAQIRTHPDRNRILRALGGSRGMGPDCITKAAQAGDAFLLCTDGFWALINEREMQADLQAHPRAEPWLNAMSRRVLARMPASADNVTAVTLMLKRQAE